MTEILFYVSIVIFSISIISAILSHVKYVRESGVGIIVKASSGEFFIAAFALCFAIIVKYCDTGIAIMFDTSVVILALSLFGGVAVTMRPYKKRRLLSFTKILPVGIYLAGYLVFFSLYYWGGTAGENEITGNIVPSLLISFHHTFRLFTLDGGYAEMASRASEFGAYTDAYVIYLGILYVMAALMTFTVLLNFVKNMNAKIGYVLTGLTFWREVHVFSSLSEESLALASSLVRPRKREGFWRRVLFIFTKPVIIFASTSDVDEKNVVTDLVEKAKEGGAILFAKDISSIRFRKTGHVYYVMGTNEGEKLRHARDLITHYGEFGNKLYVFSETEQSEIFLNGLTPGRMHLVRVNAIQSLIYRALYENGERLFRSASDANDASGDKVISAVIVGLGMYGKEMLKALTWFCQMDGYRLKIHAFDSDKNAESKLCRECPELMEMRDRKIDGEAYYSIKIETANIESKEFYDRISKITDVSYVFVCLGADEVNLRISKSIRELYTGLDKRDGIFAGRPYGMPEIETVIYDTSIKNMLSTDWSVDSFNRCDACIGGGQNFKGQPYRIHVIGDLFSFYSVETLTDDRDKKGLVKAGEEVHLRWTETGFVNAVYKRSVIKHIKKNAYNGEGAPIIWLVKPHLKLTPPTTSPLKLAELEAAGVREPIIDKEKSRAHLEGLGISYERLCDIKDAFRAFTGMKDRDNDPSCREPIPDGKWKEGVLDKIGSICLMYDNLTKNYEVVEYKEDKDKKNKKNSLFDTVELEIRPADYEPIELPPAEDAPRPLGIKSLLKLLGERAKASKARSASVKAMSPEERKAYKLDKKRAVTAYKLDKKRTAAAKKLLKSELEKGRRSFWRYTYFYRSSLAKAIHENLRVKLLKLDLIRSQDLKSALEKKTNAARNSAELKAICKLEHIRWNAFTRAEGYSHAKSKFDLAKHHDNLVPTDKLTDSDLRKDA